MVAQNRYIMTYKKAKYFARTKLYSIILKKILRDSKNPFKKKLIRAIPAKRVERLEPLPLDCYWFAHSYCF